LEFGLVAVCLDLYLGNLNINKLLVRALDCYYGAWTCSCRPGLVPGQSNINKLHVGALDSTLELGLVAVCLDLYLRKLNTKKLLVEAADCHF